MSKKQKKLLARILSAVVLFAAGLLLPVSETVKLLLYFACYLTVGYDVVIGAVTNIFHGQVFDEKFLMTVATVGALALREFSEGAAVMLFYQVGEWFQSYASARSRKSISSLMDIRPDYATVERQGEQIRLSPQEVATGETIIIKPGERIPLDGVVISGTSSLDTAALTGEALPREVCEGSEIISGCINLNGVLRAKTTKEYGESTVARILELVENSGDKKAKTEAFVTRFARYYTPIVVFAALALAILPPLAMLGYSAVTNGDTALSFALFSPWIYRALTFLVISCPCALVLSVPLSFFGGIGGASKCGVLVKGSNYLEALARVDTVVFDKTGTLTKGSFAVSKIAPQGISEDELLRLAAYAEAESSHPISLSIKKAYGREIHMSSLRDAHEIAGFGIETTVDSDSVLAGNSKLMAKHNIEFTPVEEPGTAVYIAKNGKFAGSILISDEVKPDSARAIQLLRQAGVKKTVMLTGDSKAVGEKVASELGLDRVYAELLPADKVDKLEELLGEQQPKCKLAFVGDGINDAPVLARADVGIAMGALGSDAAIEAADVVLMTDEPSKIAAAMKIARKTVAIANENIVFSIAIKVAVLLMGALGAASMWIAVFADVGVCVIAVLNAMRAMLVKKYK